MYNVAPGDVVAVYWFDASLDKGGWSSVYNAIESNRDQDYPIWSFGVVIWTDEKALHITESQAVTVGQECGVVHNLPWEYIRELYIYEKSLIKYDVKNT